MNKRRSLPKRSHPKYADDGNGVSLFEYPKSDIEHDYKMMLETFGPKDRDVVRFKKVLDNYDRSRQ